MRETFFPSCFEKTEVTQEEEEKEKGRVTEKRASCLIKAFEMLRTFPSHFSAQVDISYINTQYFFADAHGSEVKYQMSRHF